MMDMVYVLGLAALYAVTQLLVWAVGHLKAKE